MKLEQLGFDDEDVAFLRDWAWITLIGVVVFVVAAVVLGLAVRLFLAAGGI